MRVCGVALAGTVVGGWATWDPDHDGIDGAAIAREWAKAYYFQPGAPGPEVGREVISTYGTGYFYNVPPGRYLLRLQKPADASAMSCSVDPGWGWAAEEPNTENTYRVHAEAGLSNAPVRAFFEAH